MSTLWSWIRIASMVAFVLATVLPVILALIVLHGVGGDCDDLGDALGDWWEDLVLRIGGV